MKPAKSIILFFLIITCFSLFPEDDTSIPSVWKRHSPRTYHLIFTIYRIARPEKVEGVLHQVFVIPLPKSDRYHVISKVKTGPGSDIL